MCDPHALAKIEMRDALRCLEQILVAMAATNTGLSSAGLHQVARLKRRLEWCDECYSRRRSQLLLMWIAKVAAELVIQVMRPPLCLYFAAGPDAMSGLTQHIKYDNRIGYSSSAPGQWSDAEGLRAKGGHHSLVPLFNRERQEGAVYPLAA